MADHGHKRDTNARRTPRAAVIAGPLALLATASVVGLGVLGSQPDPREVITSQGATSDVAAAVDTDRREVSVSRSGSGRAALAQKKVPAPKITRLPSKVDLVTSERATRRAVGNADERLWTTDLLNLWTEPGERAERVGEIEAGKHVLVTGRTLFGRTEIVLDGRSRWVTRGYLSAEEPTVVGAACTNGTSVPSGVSPNVAKVHQAVCAAFPEITTYGTFRSDGEHGQGLAVDIMVSGDRGWQVAEFVRENYADLGVNYVIYSQQIWSVDRSGEGWRGMEDRGSTTANHYDHVHVTTY